MFESPCRQRRLFVNAVRIRRIQGLPAPFLLLRKPVMRQLLDVVHQAEELPLRIDLRLRAQRETIQPLVVAELAEHRFHRGKASAIQRAAALRIDGPLHEVGVARLAARRLAAKETDPTGGRQVTLVRRCNVERRSPGYARAATLTTEGPNGAPRGD